MTDDVDVLLSKFGENEPVRMLTGKMVQMSGGRAIVDVEGSRIPALLSGPVPQPDASVRLLFVGAQPVIIGVTTLRPDVGTVGTVGTDYVQVITDQGTYEGVKFLGTIPSTGNQVLLTWTQWTQVPVVVGVFGAAPVEPPVPPAPEPPQPVVKRDVFTATGSGTANEGSSRWWNPNVYASSSTRGIYTYGRKIRDTLRDAEPLRVEMYLITLRDSGNLPRLGTQPLESVSGSAPTVSNLIPLPRPINGWELIFDAESKQNGIAAALKAGGGIGFDGAGYAIFKGKGVQPVDDQVGALRVTYRK